MHIGIFDSGVGGLTVMRAIVKALPHLPITYFGDTARLPYGEKSRETIIRFSEENIAFLLSQNVKAIVIACHTASALALDALRDTCPVPLLGVVLPTVEKALQATHNQRIAILGTRATIASGTFQKAIQMRQPQGLVLGIACPLFVPLVEERMTDHPATRLIARDYLAPIKTQKIDTVILGSTHYPFLAPLIQEELGPSVTLIDAGAACAEQIQTLLSSAPATSTPSHRFFVSDDPDKFRRSGQHIFGRDLGPVLLSTYPET